MRTGSRQLLRRMAIWALLAPFLLLSLFPGGVMPLRTAEGIVLAICTGDGALEIRVDPESGKPVEKAPDTKRDRCDWANAAQAFTLTTSPVLLADRIGAGAVVLPVTPLVLVAGHATGLPPSTGPPVAV